jgi:hypothetical protein
MTDYGMDETCANSVVHTSRWLALIAGIFGAFATFFGRCMGISIFSQPSLVSVYHKYQFKRQSSSRFLIPILALFMAFLHDDPHRTLKCHHVELYGEIYGQCAFNSLNGITHRPSNKCQLFNHRKTHCFLIILTHCFNLRFMLSRPC